MRQYMSTNDVAERFGVSVRTVWAWLADPRINLPRPMYIGRKCYFDKDKLAEWEAEKIRKSLEAA